MKAMRSFLMLYFILDQGYSKCQDDDLGAFLGIISPELWDDGWPIDKAVFNDWIEMCQPQSITEKNIIKKILIFLDYYEKGFGFDFSVIKKWVLKDADTQVIKKAIKNVDVFYEKYKYED